MTLQFHLRSALRDSGEEFGVVEHAFALQSRERHHPARERVSVARVAAQEHLALRHCPARTKAASGCTASTPIKLPCRPSRRKARHCSSTLASAVAPGELTRMLPVLPPQLSSRRPSKRGSGSASAVAPRPEPEMPLDASLSRVSAVHSRSVRASRAAPQWSSSRLPPSSRVVSSRSGAKPALNWAPRPARARSWPLALAVAREVQRRQLPQLTQATKPRRSVLCIGRVDAH